MMGLREDFKPTRVALLFLHLMELSRNLFLKKIDILTIIYLLWMLFWLHLVLQHLLLIDLVVFASTVKSQAITSLSSSVSKKMTRKQHQSRGIVPRPQAAAVSSAPIDDPMVTVSQLESMLHRYMSQPSLAILVTLGNKSWFLDSACCNHMTLHASHFSQKNAFSPFPYHLHC